MKPVAERRAVGAIDPLSRRPWLACALALATALTAPAAAHAEIRALLIGANVYKVPGLMDLKGPVNDVSAVEALIRSQGASDITVLMDEQVTRTRVETAFHALGLRAKPGDWVLLLFAGHGAQAEAAVKGVKKDDLDDFLVLPGINPDAPQAEAYIMSADLRNWLLNYMPAGVTVVQMVDACHSGTLQRKIDPAARRFQSRVAFQARAGADAIKLTARPAPQFGPLPDAIRTTLGGADPEYLPNVIYISAAQDDQYAQEAPLPEEKSPPHGVLTYNFLTAMQAPGPDGHGLAADTNRDGVVSLGELSVYLDTQTRALTGQEQEPSIHFASTYEDRALFTHVAAAGAQAPPASAPAVYAADPVASLMLENATAWRRAARAEDADFVWSMAGGEVLRRTGDIVARGVKDRTGLEGVIEKWATVEALRPFLSEAAAHVVIGPRRNGVRYTAGEHVTVAVVPSPLIKVVAAPPAPAFVTIFNLASDGRVQTLYPVAAEDGDGRMPPHAALPVLTTEVVAPFGADHLMALFTAERPDDFRALLRTVEGSRGSGRLVSAAKRELAKPGAALSMGELFTGPET